MEKSLTEVAKILGKSECMVKTNCNKKYYDPQLSFVTLSLRKHLVIRKLKKEVIYRGKPRIWTYRKWHVQNPDIFIEKYKKLQEIIDDGSQHELRHTILRKWTQDAIDCYKIGCRCSKCFLFNVVFERDHRRCSMKKTVIELVKELGKPENIDEHKQLYFIS